MFDALLRTDILVKLPQSTDDVAVMQKSGIYISTLAHKEKYNPTHGQVLQVSDSVSNVRVGDEVFFGNHLWDVAKRRAFGDADERYKGHYVPDKVFAIKDNGSSYMILPEWMIYFAKRGDNLIGMNRYVIAEPILKQKKKTASGLILVDLEEENYEVDKAKVFLAPEGELSAGDVVHTLRHCDIVVEEQLNAPILPKRYFFIELEDIIAKYEQN